MEFDSQSVKWVRGDLAFMEVRRWLGVTDDVTA